MEVNLQQFRNAQDIAKSEAEGQGDASLVAVR